MDKYVDKILDDISQNVITDTTLIKSASPSSIIIDEFADREKIIYDLKKKDINLYTIDQFSSTLKTIMSGDVSAKDAVDLQYLSINKIKAAIDWILALGDDELKSMLSTEAWKLNYRIKPPTPEEFLTRTYIGNQADSIHPWIKDTFLKFFNPLSPYRNLILSSCIGTGKNQPLDSKVYIDKDHYKLMGDIKVGDKVMTPDGSQSEVKATIDWDNLDVYELEMDSGEKIRTGLHHIHHVSYRKDNSGNPVWENVETEFILNNPDYDYEFKKVNVNTDAERIINN